MNLCTLGERALKDYRANHNLEWRIEWRRCMPTQATASPEKNAQAHHRSGQHPNRVSHVLVSHVYPGHPFSNHESSKANGQFGDRGMLKASLSNGHCHTPCPSEGSRGRASETCYRLRGGWKGNIGGMRGDVSGTPGSIKKTGWEG